MKLSNKAYDILKIIGLVVLYALSLIIVLIGNKIGMSDELIKLCSGTLAAAGTALGGILGFSSAQYYKEEADEPAEDAEPQPPKEHVATIYLSPSQQKGNLYAVGNTNEKEQCEKIAAACRDALVAHGFDVVLTPEKDVTVRVKDAFDVGADWYIPIHTNAFDGTVSGTRMFVRDMGDEPDLTMCKAVFKRLDACCPGTSSNIKTYPNLYEFRTTSPIPAIYCECDFHDNVEAAQFIITHQKEIGESIARGICDFYNIDW